MKKFIGNKDFYKLVAALALPLLLQLEELMGIPPV